MESIRSYLNRLVTDFGPLDVVEFLLIALVIYVIYRFLRGTRGARVFRGFIFLLIAGFILVQLLASILNLERVQIIYNKLIQLAVVGIQDCPVGMGAKDQSLDRPVFFLEVLHKIAFEIILTPAVIDSAGLANERRFCQHVFQVVIVSLIRHFGRILHDTFG